VKSDRWAERKGGVNEHDIAYVAGLLRQQRGSLTHSVLQPGIPASALVVEQGIAI